MGVVFVSGSLAKPTARPRRPRVLQADPGTGMAGPHRPRRVQLAGLLPDPDAHAFANRIHQRALCAPRFFGAGPLTWSSGPSTPFPSDAWAWTCYYPSCFAASHATPPLPTFYCSRFPPRPECPTFYRPGPSHPVRPLQSY